MTDQTHPEQPAPRRRIGPVTALAAGSLAGIVLGFGGIASAQTAETPAPSPSTSADATQDDELCDEDDATADTADSTAGTAESSSAA